jgi:hypothetical protein
MFVSKHFKAEQDKHCKYKREEQMVKLLVTLLQ